MGDSAAEKLLFLYFQLGIWLDVAQDGDGIKQSRSVQTVGLVERDS